MMAMPLHAVEIAVAGTVAVAARLNIRQGAPSRTAAVFRKQDVDAILDVVAVTSGDEVQGNRLWFRLADGSYVWSGACGPLTQVAAQGIPAASAPAPTYTPAVAAEHPAANVVDVYHGDSVTSFHEARVAGVLGVIHKATTGGTGRDDQYRNRRKAAVDAGLLWGAYHWGTGAAADDQATNFLEWADPDERTLVALDFELWPGNQMTLERAREFLQIVGAKLKRKPVIYSGSTIKSALGTTRDEFFGSHRLWLAQYGPVPQVQASWASYWLWQFTEGKAGDPRRRRVAGIPGNTAGELDCDYFPRTADELAAEWAS
jgi:GH25 family lysozyme M1 (1,4-beta-N-acetylmuramidase)